MVKIILHPQSREDEMSDEEVRQLTIEMVSLGLLVRFGDPEALAMQECLLLEGARPQPTPEKE